MTLNIYTPSGKLINQIPVRTVEEANKLAPETDWHIVCEHSENFVCADCAFRK